jgi:Tfp pilus assembly protein PilX
MKEPEMRTRYIRRRTQSEEGASLVIVLVFTTLFALVVSGLLTESTVSVKYTTTVASHEAKVYAADAGVSVGIQQVRLHNEVCWGPGVTGTLSVTTPAAANMPAVNVKCEGTSGSSLGVRGHALMLTKSSSGAAAKLTTQSGGGTDKVIQGPIYVEGTLDLQAPVKVLRGDFTQVDAGCTSATPSNVIVADVGYAYRCFTTKPVNNPFVPTTPDHAEPAVPTTENPAPTITNGGTRAVWSPGKYTSAPALVDGENYFKSGVYYFDFDGQWVVGDNQKVWGGLPASTETPNFSLPSWTTGIDDSSVVGTGVLWAFGKTATIYSNKGQVELFARQFPTGVTGTSSLSMVAVPHDWSWPDKSTAGVTLMDIASGSNSNFAVHGLIYAPDQTMSLWATNGVAAQVLGGVVANQVILQASASATGMAVSVVGDKPLPRYVKIVASTTSGGKPVESTAVVKLDNDLGVPAEIQSWRTRGIPDPT